PWWEVKLAEGKPIDQIVIWNRTDGGVGGRLANFRVQVLDDEHKVVWQQDIAEPPKPKRELSPSGKQTVALTLASANYSQPHFPVKAALTGEANKGWAVGPKVKELHAAVFITAVPLNLATPMALTFHLEHNYKGGPYTLGRFRLAATTDTRV